MRGPIGLRISARRRALNISQASLARTVGVSPSYLNLIEADKRQVGGLLLQKIANELGIALEELTGASEHRLIHELIEAFADPLLAGSGMGPEQARTMVATSPEIATMVTQIFRAYSAAMSTVEAYQDRLRADPLLSQLLHQILSGITAVRSSAEILDAVPDLEPSDQRRFLGSITRETLGLTDVARNLIGQFDQTSTNREFASARREVDDMIFNAQNHFPEMEDIAQRLRLEIAPSGPLNEAELIAFLARQHKIRVTRIDTQSGGKAFSYNASEQTIWFRNNIPLSTRQFQLAQLIAELEAQHQLQLSPQVQTLQSPLAQRGARRYLSSYIAGAILFPYDDILRDAKETRYDIDTLCERYSASFEQIAHRLVTLKRPGQSGTPFGFLRSDVSGRLSKHFPLPGLLLPNSGHACPLWAVYSAFQMPGKIMRQIARFPDGSRFLFVAKAVTRRQSAYNDPVVPHSILLATNILHADETVYGDGLNLADSRFDTPVGPACRICTRPDCPSRQEDPWSPDGESAPSTLV
jgi:predicted transcriptional regulator/DNA-binding XRE family transcriptional regulator